MSAFLVSQRHIAAIATAGEHMGYGPHSLGETLLRANHRSLAVRYPADGGDTGEPYEHRECVVTDAELVKACDCFEYQACEPDDWEETPAFRYIQVIRAGALERLGWTTVEHGWMRQPAWEAAPWGLPEWGPRRLHDVA